MYGHLLHTEGLGKSCVQYTTETTANCMYWLAKGSYS